MKIRSGFLDRWMKEEGEGINIISQVPLHLKKV